MSNDTNHRITLTKAKDYHTDNLINNRSSSPLVKLRRLSVGTWPIVNLSDWWTLCVFQLCDVDCPWSRLWSQLAHPGARDNPTASGYRTREQSICQGGDTAVAGARRQPKCQVNINKANKNLNFSVLVLNSFQFIGRLFSVAIERTPFLIKCYHMKIIPYLSNYK